MNKAVSEETLAGIEAHLRDDVRWAIQKHVRFIQQQNVKSSVSAERFSEFKSFILDYANLHLNIV